MDTQKTSSPQKPTVTLPNTQTQPPAPQVNQSVNSTPPTGVASDSTLPNGQVPEEIRGWNWGAFLLNWIWGIAHGVWISLLMFIPIVNIVIWFVLGAKGNEWAWKSRKFESVEHFKKVQRIWAYWGLGLLIAQLILTGILFSAGFSAFGNLESINQDLYNIEEMNSDINLNPNTPPAPTFTEEF